MIHWFGWINNKFDLGHLQRKGCSCQVNRKNIFKEEKSKVRQDGKEEIMGTLERSPLLRVWLN